MKAMTTSGLGSWARCCSGFAGISRAAAKATRAKLRQFGWLGDATDWSRKAIVCESCPMRVLYKRVTYCGKPFVHLPVRDDAQDGCGCPTLAKAKTPGEHCPVDSRHQPATTTESECNCKWCSLKQVR